MISSENGRLQQAVAYHKFNLLDPNKKEEKNT